MSAYTTVNLSRSMALGIIGEYMLQCSNKELERLADIALEPQLYNCQIHYDGVEVPE